jgi:farnesyl-diphosphate farnesyltransferase
MEPTPSRSVEPRVAAGDGDQLQAFLQKTSRTFALSIPLLPEPTRTEIGVAYLLFRIIDTFEDATGWPPPARIEALAELIRLLDDGDARRASAVAARWVKDPPLANASYLELLAATPRVIEWYRRLAGPARAELRRHLERSAHGMAEFIRRTNGGGVLRLETMDDLGDYCFAVAGIVGEMLTELFVLGSPPLASVAAELRARSVRFGEGLQLVNILKDAHRDAAEGRVYLPRQVSLPEVFVRARADLRVAAEYVELMRRAGADRGLIAFNALNARLATATLRLLRDRGLGAKLTRPQVAALLAEVIHRVQSGVPVFDQAGLDQG